MSFGLNRIEIGRYNRLEVHHLVDFGAYLTLVREPGVEEDTDPDTVLMPKRYLPKDAVPGTVIEDAFVYLDSEDRIVATTETPLAQVGEVAYLECKSVSQVGAFLDWGLLKDLLVPFREQAVRMQPGNRYIVYIYVDPRTRRIVASEKVDGFLDNIAPRYERGDAVQGIIIKRTPMGFKAAINNTHTGLLYDNQIFREVKIGDRMTLYVEKVREDDKIDLLAQPIGLGRTDALESAILERLRAHNGRLEFGDKSNPEVIAAAFGCSKKTFKMTCGRLMKRGLVRVEPYSVELV